MLWDPRAEMMPRAELEALQFRRLQETVWRAYLRVPFYRKALDSRSISPADLTRLQDLTRLPFTRKTDFRDHYPFGLFAVPRHEVLRIHASSGTSGRPIVVGYTRNDLGVWAEVCARCLASSGAQPGDILHNAYGYGLFTGGLGFHYGAELMGLTVVPVSGGLTDRQLLLLQDFRPQILCCTPSYALTLAEAMAERQIAAAALGLRAGLFGAEPWTEEMRRQIEAKLCLKAVNIYGLTEVVGPGVSCECAEAQDGAHIYEDHFLPEVIDPETGDPLPPGEAGELVFTTLTKEALPVLRYRTGDIASLDPEPCQCGRTFVRMSRIRGRTDDMLIIRGVNVFPSQIEAALVGMPGLSPHYQLIVEREKTLDTLEVKVEVDEAFFGQVRGQLEAPAAQALHGHAVQRLKGILGLSAVVTLSAPGSLPRSEGGKLRRVMDRRAL